MQGGNGMKCGFNRGMKDEECTEKCKYFDTCTRNPHRNNVKDGKKNDGNQMDKDNH